MGIRERTNLLSIIYQEQVKILGIEESLTPVLKVAEVIKNEAKLEKEPLK